MTNRRIPERDIQAFLSVSAEYLGVHEEQLDPGNGDDLPDPVMDVRYNHLFSQPCTEGSACHA